MKPRGGDHREQGQKEEARQELLRSSSAAAQPIASRDEPDIGQSFAIELQRHARRPKLWRLRMRQVAADGTTSIKNTDWAEFYAFSPDLLLAQGQLKRFIFGDSGRAGLQRVG